VIVPNSKHVIANVQTETVGPVSGGRHVSQNGREPRAIRAARRWKGMAPGGGGDRRKRWGVKIFIFLIDRPPTILRAVAGAGRRWQ